MKLSQLCEFLSGVGFACRLEGEDRLVHAVNTLSDAGEGEVSFLANPKYRSALARTRATAVILKDGPQLPEGVSGLRCGEPYAALTASIIKLHGYRKHPEWGMSEGALIDPSAKFGANPNIAPGATVAARATLGDDCTVYPGCYVGEGATLGDRCTLFPNVVIYDGSVLGDRVTIHAGSVIGEDGLGYVPHEGKLVKIPQIGIAVLGDDVEIGANCTIDRSTLGQTEIGSGTKFGNVVVIGHGSKVGSDCLLVGLVGVAGSTTIERQVTLAGQVGVSGHLTIGEGTRVGAQAGISGDVPAGSELLGSPAMPSGRARRAFAAVAKLPEWTKRVRDLEREVRELKEQMVATSKSTDA